MKLVEKPDYGFLVFFIVLSAEVSQHTVDILDCTTHFGFSLDMFGVEETKLLTHN